MAINFPTTPAQGALFTSGGVTWQWDGSKWIPASTSNTSFLPLSGGTMTGPLLLQSDPAQPLNPASKQYVDNNISPAVYSWMNGGHINKIRNGSFDVWQRGTSWNPQSGAYTADGWIVGANPTGGTIPVTRLLYGSGAPVGGQSAMQVSGVAGNTAMTITQRMEACIASQLGQNGKVAVTFSCWVSSGIAIAPQLRVDQATVLDTFSTTTTVAGPFALQPVPGGNQWTRLGYTFTIPNASAQYGLQVVLMLGAYASSACTIGAVDLRDTPGLPVGLCNNPPPPELRDIATELNLCQRYYETSYGNGVAPGTAVGNGQDLLYVGVSTGSVSTMGKGILFKVGKRVAPTMTAYSPNSGTAGAAFDANSNVNVAANLTSAGSAGFYWTAPSSVPSSTINIRLHWAASAEV